MASRTPRPGPTLTFRILNQQTVEVRPRSQTPAGGDTTPRKLRKARREQLLEEVVVVGMAEQLVATRVPTPLREIPQTVSIISPEQMRQQNDTDLADVLAHAPGITMVRTSSLDQDFYSRGYQIASFHVDGGAALNPRIDPELLFLSTPDLSEFDHIEVLRGADALFGGNGNPGGTVSLVRKRPRDAYNLDCNASGGSWDNYRVEAE